ncbi:MAG: protein translocase subunit SecD [candidate division KSB1 bacterium]|nr:protein translocase subunit SecD [candidate division KSB1 bacterium]
MQRRLLYRTLLVVVVVVVALYQLYPTVRVSGLEGKLERQLTELSRITGAPVADLRSALATGELEGKVRRLLADEPGTLDRATALVRQIIRTHEAVGSLQDRAIKKGLDLQGGTYLVYEVDIPGLLDQLAHNKDERFQEIVRASVAEMQATGGDFFDILRRRFDESNLRLSRYFGKMGESDDKIISDLRREAEDAVDRTLEKLRYRIDQFGVSEPAIHKQGAHRIVVELAGVHDVERAKRIIGTTALLEFKLEKDPQVVQATISAIDRTLRRIRSGQADTTALARIDTTQRASRKAEEAEVDVSELFGQAAEQVGVDTGQVVVDRQTFEEAPFSSLLRQLPGVTGEIAVPVQNMRTVDRLLKLPEIQNAIPRDAEFLWSSKPIRLGGSDYYLLYLVNRNPELVGKYITAANVRVGAGESSLRGNEPRVTLTLDTQGARIFARVTGANVGKKLAIVLDGRVASAPVIRERIPSGNAQIDGLDTMEEAKDLALVLRTGALPAPVEVIEERTVGPSLGQDSIDKGQKAAIVGAILVVLFMVFYYRGSGLIADFALALNIVLILAALAAFRATLTMPGIAGITLTIGMAVDANVLIFERIREELRTGKTVRAAVDAGFSRAFVTILDANVTTLLTALVLYQFGTGPIRGFAVTLSIGLIANMFTAVFVARVIYDHILARKPVTASLSI